MKHSFPTFLAPKKNRTTRLGFRRSTFRHRRIKCNRFLQIWRNCKLNHFQVSNLSCRRSYPNNFQGLTTSKQNQAKITRIYKLFYKTSSWNLKVLLTTWILDLGMLRIRSAATRIVCSSNCKSWKVLRPTFKRWRQLLRVGTMSLSLQPSSVLNNSKAEWRRRRSSSKISITGRNRPIGNSKRGCQQLQQRAKQKLLPLKRKQKVLTMRSWSKKSWKK